MEALPQSRNISEWRRKIKKQDAEQASLMVSNNKKKNEIEKMKEIRDKARDKANELQMQ